MVLVDTSIWIESLRKGTSLRISSKFRPEEIFIALPIYQEVLHGILNEEAYLLAKSAMSAAAFIENPLSIAVFDEAASLYRLARKKGITPRSSIDCIIAICAIRHNLIVVHRDRDYQLLAKVSPLKERQM